MSAGDASHTTPIDRTSHKPRVRMPSIDKPRPHTINYPTRTHAHTPTRHFPNQKPKAKAKVKKESKSSTNHWTSQKDCDKFFSQLKALKLQLDKVVEITDTHVRAQTYRRPTKRTRTHSCCTRQARSRTCANHTVRHSLTHASAHALSL